ncbi:TPA: hypothetical protein DCS99_04920, partial [Candidatus Wolfebacteria bacterium]|nr:hypothetical protein [Candidatus Wolfebacteria bacterium]
RVRFPLPAHNLKTPGKPPGVFKLWMSRYGNRRVSEKYKLLYIFQNPGFEGGVEPVRIYEHDGATGEKDSLYPLKKNNIKAFEAFMLFSMKRERGY